MTYFIAHLQEQYVVAILVTTNVIICCKTHVSPQTLVFVNHQIES
jgi:hypothetical protein